MKSLSKPPVLPGLVSLLRAGVLAVAAAILCWPLTVTSGVLLAVLGALAGAVAADMASRMGGDSSTEPARRLRLGSVLTVCLLVLVVGVALTRFAVSLPSLAKLAGPVATLWLAEASMWFFLITPVIFALRFTAARIPLAAVLEVLTVGGALVLSLAAHREGMVHRPLTIGDWAWSRGIDPALVLLGLGGAVTLLLAALLVSEQRRKRLPLHFAGLVALAVALLLMVRVTGLPKPDAGGLGLTGDPEEESDQQDGDEQAEGGGGSSGEKSEQLDDLEFKDEYSSSGEQAPVAVVLLHDDYSPPVGVYYFRQTAFSQYNGRRLVHAMRDDVDRDIVPRFPSRPVRVANAPPTSDQRMALKTTMALMIDHVRPFALDAPAALRPIRNPDPMRFQRTFEVLSHVQTLPYDEMLGQRAGDRSWNDDQWEHYTEAPSDPRYRDLAERALGRLKRDYRDDPLGRAMAVKTYLDENGIYSLRSRHADAADPTASFLFGDLTGYCVHFAHASAYLLRSLGVPSRVAVGYAVEEGARGSGSTIMVRGADAHAWPEIYLENVGWVVVDLAPQQTLDEPVGAPDQRLQSMLGEMLRQQFQDEMSPENTSPPIDWAAFWRRFVMLCLALLAVAYGVKFYRVLAAFLGRPPQRYRMAYRASLDRLAEVGLMRRFGESREHFAERARNVAPSFEELTREHLCWALGSAERREARGISGLMVRVETDLRRRVPAWKRVLGYLNPVSWLMAR